MNQGDADGEAETRKDQKMAVKFVAGSGKKKKYSDLIDTRLQPPAVQHSHSLRSSKRPRRESSSLSVESNDPNDTESSHPDVTSENDGDDLSDAKPPASPTTSKQSGSIVNGKSKLRCSSLKPKSVATEKITQSLASSQKDEQPFQLHHRLFEPIGGRGKRSVARSVYKSPNEISRKRVKSTLSRLSNEDKDEDSDVKNCSKSLAKQPPKFELPVNAVIRDSITHQVLLKVKRLDSQCLYDDPYQTVKESGGRGEMAAATEKSTENVHMHDVIGKLLPDVRSDALKSPLRVCIRSAVLPQQSKKLSPEKNRVVILHGPHRGKTGMLSDVLGRHML
jgi:hypothetical protein